MHALPVFYYDFNSPYAYLAAERIDDLIPGAEWRPIAFAIVLNKLGRLEDRLEGLDVAPVAAEISERAAARGLPPFAPPEGWPVETGSLTPLRAALGAGEGGRHREFSRAAYRTAATDLLVSDLKEMVANWAPEGAAAKAVEADPKAGLAAILTGMGSLSYGELAGERMKLGLLLHDPEEEHDCFSDNTHNSHLHDAIGIQSAYTGEYTRIDGTKLTGPSLSKLVAAKDAALDKEMTANLATTVEKMQAMAKRAETEAYDQMIGEGNAEGNATVQAAIDGLITQAKTVERVIAALDLGTIELEGSDSLDNPNAVFQ